MLLLTKILSINKVIFKKLFSFIYSFKKLSNEKVYFSICNYYCILR